MQTYGGIASRGREVSFGLLLVFLATAFSVTQAADNTGLPPSPALEEGQCNAASALNTAGALPFAVSDLPKTRDRACLVSIADAQRRRIQDRATFIDIRLPEHFQNYHIPGSLNMSLHAIKTKGFLKNTAIILIHEGRTSVELEQACQELRKQGFAHVSLLDGGLNAWHEAQGALAGDILAQRRLNYVTPEELFVEHDYADWLVLDFSDGKRKSVYQWLPQKIEHMVQAKQTSPDAQIAALRSTVERYRELVPHLKILVVSDTEVDYGHIAASVLKARLEKVLYLGYGLKGYNDFLTKQMAIWHQKSRPFKSPSCQG